MTHTKIILHVFVICKKITLLGLSSTRANIATYRNLSTRPKSFINKKLSYRNPTMLQIIFRPKGFRIYMIFKTSLKGLGAIAQQKTVPALARSRPGPGLRSVGLKMVRFWPNTARFKALAKANKKALMQKISCHSKKTSYDFLKNANLPSPFKNQDRRFSQPFVDQNWRLRKF